jgi:serine phosphatase RsbU (regulator of sigma subunit)
MDGVERESASGVTVDGVSPWVLITLTDGRVLKSVLTGESQVLGRDPSCDILLDDPSASRRHALLRREGEDFWVEDLGSKNGTLVNDERVHKRRLSHLDEILLGSVEVRFLSGEASGSGSAGSGSAGSGSAGSGSAGSGSAGSVIVSDSPIAPSSPSYTTQSASLQLNERRLKVLYDLSDRLTTLRHRKELLEDAMSVCFEHLRFERGAIAVKRPDGRLVDWPVVRNLRGQSGELTVSQSILGRALNHGERAIVTDGATDKVDPTVSMVQHGIRSAMCVPLMLGAPPGADGLDARAIAAPDAPREIGGTRGLDSRIGREGEILGVIYGDRVSTGTIYTKEEVDFFAGIARLVTIGLVNARLMDEQKQKLELEAELGVAREIQQRLFPRVLPKSEKLEFAALNEPGRMVSGDYYDVAPLDDGRTVFLIADVTGEGVAAALLMSNLQAAVRLTLQDDVDDIGALMGRWNRLISANTGASKFVTCAAGVVDPTTRSIDFAMAGHPQPYVIYAGEKEPTALWIPPGFPLGVVESAEYETKRIDMGEEPCVLLTFTDGVFEAVNSNDDFFGEERMLEVLRSSEDLNPSSLVRRMRKAVSAFARDARQSDDITMLAVALG